jgi:hypothetical protein
VIGRLAAVGSAAKTGDAEAGPALRRLGRAGLVYLASVRIRTGLLADRLGVRGIVRAPAMVACSLSPVESDPTFPLGHRGYEWTIDQLANEHAAVAVGTGDQRALDYTFGAGVVSSLLEHAALTACEGGVALSTTHLFARAAREPQLPLRAQRSDGVIRIWTEGAAEVEAWQGGAILSLEPESLAGLYELAGGILGGVLTRSFRSPTSLGPERPLSSRPDVWPLGTRGAGAFAVCLGAARERSRHPRSWWQGPMAAILAAEELEALGRTSGP